MRKKTKNNLSRYRLRSRPLLETMDEETKASLCESKWLMNLAEEIAEQIADNESEKVREILRNSDNAARQDDLFRELISPFIDRLPHDTISAGIRIALRKSQSTKNKSKHAASSQKRKISSSSGRKVLPRKLSKAAES